MNRQERRRAERDARRRGNERPWVIAYYDEDTGDLIGGAIVLAPTGVEACSRAWSLGIAMDGAAAIAPLAQGKRVCSDHVDTALSVNDVVSLDPRLASIPGGECVECAQP